MGRSNNLMCVMHPGKAASDCICIFCEFATLFLFCCAANLHHFKPPLIFTLWLQCHLYCFKISFQPPPSHKYSLRSRRNTPSDLLNGSFLGNIPSPSKHKELMNRDVQQRSARRYTAVIHKPRPNNNSDDTPLFSSDEEC